MIGTDKSRDTHPILRSPLAMTRVPRHHCDQRCKRHISRACGTCHASKRGGKDRRNREIGTDRDVAITTQQEKARRRGGEHQKTCGRRRTGQPGGRNLFGNRYGG